MQELRSALGDAFPQFSTRAGLSSSVSFSSLSISLPFSLGRQIKRLFFREAFPVASHWVSSLCSAFRSKPLFLCAVGTIILCCSVSVRALCDGRGSLCPVCYSSRKQVTKRVFRNFSLHELMNELNLLRWVFF